MAKRFESLCWMLCLAASAPAAYAAEGGIAPRVGPSDCSPRDADSTCATAVAGATLPGLPSGSNDATLYDGPLGGVPASGYAYWGFDFISDESGGPSPVRPDEFINRSRVPVTIKLSFDLPTDHPCGKGCLPRVEFEVGPGWSKRDPAVGVVGNVASFTEVFAPGQGYAWVIGLWQSGNPRLTVSIPKNTSATLRDVGLSAFPAIATEIAAIQGICDCSDGSSGACSDGSHFSNGLLGVWLQNQGFYLRSGAFDECSTRH